MKNIINDPHARYKLGYVDTNKNNEVTKQITKTPIEPTVIPTNKVDNNITTSNIDNVPSISFQQLIDNLKFTLSENKKIIFIGLVCIAVVGLILLAIKLLPETSMFSSSDKKSTSNRTGQNSSQYNKHQNPATYLEKKKIFMEHFIDNNPEMKKSFNDLMLIDDIFTERLVGASVGDLLVLWPEQKSIDIANLYLEGIAQRAAQKYRTSINMVQSDFANCNNVICEEEKEEVEREVNMYYLFSTNAVAQISWKIESVKSWGNTK